jgi:Zn ribbon nucleic-acid-binding protein
MAKAKQKEVYEFIRAEVDCGELVIKSRLIGNAVTAICKHDEDVSEWSETEIKQCVKFTLALDYDETKLIEVQYS